MGFNYCSVWAKISGKFERARIKQTTCDCKSNQQKNNFLLRYDELYIIATKSNAAMNNPGNKGICNTL